MLLGSVRILSIEDLLQRLLVAVSLHLVLVALRLGANLQNVPDDPQGQSDNEQQALQTDEGVQGADLGNVPPPSFRRFP